MFDLYNVFLLCHYVMLFSVCIIYVTAISFMCFANKHIIIIIIIIILSNVTYFTMI
jgi:hypothetical protein